MSIGRPGGSRITECISLGVITKFFPLERAREVLAETERAFVSGTRAPTSS